MTHWRSTPCGRSFRGLTLLFWVVVFLLMGIGVAHYAIAQTVVHGAECPVDRPIKKKALASPNVVICDAVACTTLVCPKGGSISSITIDNVPVIADCYYIQGACNKCSMPEPVDICLTEEELRKASGQ